MHVNLFCNKMLTVEVWVFSTKKAHTTNQYKWAGSQYHGQAYELNEMRNIQGMIIVLRS